MGESKINNGVVLTIIEKKENILKTWDIDKSIEGHYRLSAVLDNGVQWVQTIDHLTLEYLSMS